MQQNKERNQFQKDWETYFLWILIWLRDDQASQIEINDLW